MCYKINVPQKSTYVRARCDQRLKDAVSELAARFGLDESDIVRIALRDYVRQHSDGDALTLQEAQISGDSEATAQKVIAARDQAAQAAKRRILEAREATATKVPRGRRQDTKSPSA